MKLTKQVKVKVRPGQRKVKYS